MSNIVELRFPVGRLVQGSLYTPQTTNAENAPLKWKSGPNQGQDRVTYYFGIAIAKTGETHWSQTPWGKVVWDTGHAAFPNGQAQRPGFAWKIIDGDSTEPNSKGVRPCDKIGFPKHWVLNFASSYAPSILKMGVDGKPVVVTEEDFILPGYFVEVFATIAGNDSQQQPGIYLNHKHVCFAAYGDRINYGTDPASVGFGQYGQLPPGASAVPLSPTQPAATAVPPAHAYHVQPAAPAPQYPAPVAAQPVQPVYPTQPHTQILTPQPVQPIQYPAPVAAQPVHATPVTPMLPPEVYAQYIAAGYTPEMIANLPVAR